MGYCPFSVSVVTENSLSRQRIQVPCCDSECSVVIGVSLARCFESLQGLSRSR